MVQASTLNLNVVANTQLAQRNIANFQRGIVSLTNSVKATFLPLLTGFGLLSLFSQGLIDLAYWGGVSSGLLIGLERALFQFAASAAAALTEAFAPAVTSVLEGLTAIIEFLNKFSIFGETLTTWLLWAILISLVFTRIVNTITAIGKIFGALITFLRSIFNYSKLFHGLWWKIAFAIIAIGNRLQAIGGIWRAIGNAIVWVVSRVVSFVFWIRNIGAIIASIASVIGIIAGAIASLPVWVVVAIAAAVAAIGFAVWDAINGFKLLGPIIKSIGRIIGDILLSAVNGVIDALNLLFDMVNLIISGLNEIIKLTNKIPDFGLGLIPSIPNIPFIGTNQPTSRAPNINVNVYGDNFASDLEDKIEQGISRALNNPSFTHNAFGTT